MNGKMSQYRVATFEPCQIAEQQFRPGMNEVAESLFSLKNESLGPRVFLLTNVITTGQYAISPDARRGPRPGRPPARIPEVRQADRRSFAPHSGAGQGACL